MDKNGSCAYWFPVFRKSNQGTATCRQYKTSNRQIPGIAVLCEPTIPIFCFLIWVLPLLCFCGLLKEGSKWFQLREA